MKLVQRQCSIHYSKDFLTLENPQSVQVCTSSIDAMQDAYAAYSHFKVGAAILLANGKIVKGSNQENAVYPLGLCAERVALFSAATQAPGERILSLAVTTTKELINGDLPAFPCGSCRQVIVEFEQRQKSEITLYIVGSDRSVCVVEGVKNILPFAFDSASL